MNGEMVLNDAGIMLDNEWVDLPHRFKPIRLDAYIIMPNHFHAILEIVSPATVGVTLVVARNPNAADGQPQGIAPTVNPTVGDMMGAFQSIVPVKYIHGVKTKKWQPFHGKLWQRNYWDHIVRNKMELNQIRQYIQNNPKKWRKDKLQGGIGNNVMENSPQYGEEIWMF